MLDTITDLDPSGDLAGMVITADALHTHRAHVTDLAARGVHWVLSVKGNPPTLRRQLAGLPWRGITAAHRSAETGHGRREIRTLKVVTIAAGIVFPHARQAIQITRRTRPVNARSGRKGRRKVELPSWAVQMLRRRRLAATDPNGPVFTAPLGGLRDPSNTNADLREAFDAAGYPWVTSHVYRKTVATLMDITGLSARAAADQIGHAKVSMTQDNYFGRHVARTGAAKILELINDRT